MARDDVEKQWIKNASIANRNTTRLRFIKVMREQFGVEFDAASAAYDMSNEILGYEIDHGTTDGPVPFDVMLRAARGSNAY